MGIPFCCFSQIITTIAGTGTGGHTGDYGPATNARLNVPSSLAIDAEGNIYINCQKSNCVRKVSPTGIITTIAGTGNIAPGFGGDGGPATDPAVSFGYNWGIAVDVFGNVLITDQDNSRIRQINTSGILNTIAGAGFGDIGFGGPATAAKMGAPMGITLDGSGNIYFTDQNKRHVDKIDLDGTITRIAGDTTSITPYGGDGGPATNALLSRVFGIAVDNTGNVYICDAVNNRIRKINTAGYINTIAGTGTAGFSGDSGPATAAKLNNPTGICISNSGYIYIADYGNHRVRMINPSGTITTVAGTGLSGYNGDNIPAVNARLSLPLNVMLDQYENLYIAEEGNNRVRKVINILSFTGGEFQGLSVCENSTPVAINSLLQVRDVNTGSNDVWTLYQAPVHGTANVSYSAVSPGGVFTPTGLTYEPVAGYVGHDSFKVKVANTISSDIITIFVTIDPPSVSAGTITGPTNVCVGSTITLNDNTPDGVWTSGPLATVTPLTLGCSLKGVAPGVDTVMYIISNSCGTVYTNYVVTINPLPDAGTINGPDAVCLGKFMTLTATQAGGTWSSSSTKAVVTSAGVVNGVSAGTATIIYTVVNTWCTNTTLHNIRIDTFPDAGTIIGPMRICEGDQMVLTNAVTNGSWSSSNSVLSVINGTVMAESVGIADISYTVSNSCGIAFNIKTVTVNPIPDAPLVTENQGLLSVPNTYNSYQWFVNGDVIPGATADTCGTSITGIYNVRVTNAFGCINYSQPLEHTECILDDMRIYPNPTASVLNIQWCKKVTVRLMCADGKEVTVNQNVNSVDMSMLPNGIYFLSIFDKKGNKLMTTRITKLTK